MKLAVQVNEGPYQHQASDSAYHFTKAALEKGHEVFRVFFYHDGVLNGTRLTTPPQDDRNWVKSMTSIWCCALPRPSAAASWTTERPSVTEKTRPTLRPSSAFRAWGNWSKPLSKVNGWLYLAINGV